MMVEKIWASRADKKVAAEDVKALRDRKRDRKRGQQTFTLTGKAVR